MSSTARRTDPELWERIKQAVTAGDKGGRAGQWSARKAQLATAEYKKAGGGYVGGKAKDNSLAQWTGEDWGTKSGKASGETGERYLPHDAREALSDAEYRRTTAAKRAATRRSEQFSAQPADIARKTAAYRDGGAPTKAALYAEAKRKGVKGRSTMSKAALAKALGR